jgi:hypothetical protein
MRKTFAYFAAASLTLSFSALAQPPATKGVLPPGRAANQQDKVGKPGERPSGTVPGLGAPPSEAEKLLDEAIEKIKALKQFRTDIRQLVEMLGYKFTADGQYAVAPDYRMLFELKVQLTNTSGTLIEVCDGREHWRSRRILDTRELIRLDMRKIREVLDKPEFGEDVRGQLVQFLGFSGIVPLLRSLRDSQKFETYEEDTIGEVPVYQLQGRWREEAINQVTFRGQQLSLANLPGYIPDKCTVWIGRDDGWPHRVRLESSKKVQGSTTVVTLEFLNPELDAELSEEIFFFQPPADVSPIDQTDVLYEQLTGYLQAQQAAKAKGAAEGATAPAKKPE